MIEINPLLICSIITKVRQFQVKSEVEDDIDFVNNINDEKEELRKNKHTLASDDVDYQILNSNHDDPTYDELKKEIGDLDREQQATLITLLWLGRGDIDISECDQAFEDAMSSLNDQTPKYLLSKPHLADYLEEALYQFGYEYIE